MTWNRPYCIHLWFADKYRPTRFCEGPEEVREFIEDQRDPGLFRGPIAPPPKAAGVFMIEDDGECHGDMMFLCTIEALIDNPVHLEDGCEANSTNTTNYPEKITCPDCAYIYEMEENYEHT